MNRWLGAIAIALVVGAAHRASFEGTFLFDDREAIVSNPELDRIGFGAPDQSPVAGRPVVAFSLSVDTALWGRGPRGYHIQNWLAHIASALLVGYLVRAALRDAHPRAGELALGCALLWGVHPLQTEAVTYLTQRTELFVTLFTLGALVSTERRARTGRAVWTAVAAACALLACGSKESAVVIPPLALLFDRAFLAPGWREVRRARGRHHLALASTFAVVAFIVAQGYRSQSVGGDLGITPWAYLKTQAEAIARYARLTVWPDALTLDYGPPHPPPLAEALLPGLAILAAAAGALLLYRRRPALGFWALLPFIALAPTSTVVPIVTEYAAERRMYLALLGPVVLFALVLDRVCRRAAGAARGAQLFRVALLVMVAAGALATSERERLYRDPLALWHDAIDAWPGNGRAHGNLGIELVARKRVDEAEREFERALALEPDYDNVRFYLAAILMAKGLHERALEHLSRIAADHAEHRLVELWSGIAAERTGRFAEAIASYREVLALDPVEPTARNNLAWILATCPAAEHRDPAAALALIEPIYRPGEGTGDHRDTAAACLAANGRFEEARREAELLCELAEERVRAARTPEAVSIAAMLEVRRDHYARGESYIDRAEHGVTRSQGALRRITVDFSW